MTDEELWERYRLERMNSRRISVINIFTGGSWISAEQFHPMTISLYKFEYEVINRG